MFVSPSTCSNVNKFIALAAGTAALPTAGMAIILGVAQGFSPLCYGLISASAGCMVVCAGAAYFARRFHPLNGVTYVPVKQGLSATAMTDLQGLVAETIGQ